MEASEDELRMTIERARNPIAGSLDLRDGCARRFEGYVALVAVLESVREPPGGE